MNPLVSVVFAVAGDTEFGAQALETVLTQTYLEWELILVEPTGSFFPVPPYVRGDERVRTLRYDGASPSNRSRLQNAGVAAARGQYFAFLDAGEAWLPERLETQVAEMEAAGASAVYGPVQLWYSWTGRPEDVDRDLTPDCGVAADRLYAPPELLRLVQPLGPTAGPRIGDLLIRRDAFERVGRFDEELPEYISEVALIAKISAAERVFVSGKSMTRRRVHSEPAGWSQNLRHLSKERTNSLLLTWLTQWLEKSNIADSEIQLKLEKARRAYPRAQDVQYKAWHFRVAERSDAKLEAAAIRPNAVRVELTACAGEQPHDVQLNLKHQIVAESGLYSIRFEARADSLRNIQVGFSMAREPWLQLGLYRKVELTPEWKAYDLAFTATANFDNARIHFDLGGEATAVELDGAGLFLADGIPAPSLAQFGNLRRLTPVSRYWGFDRGTPIDRHYIEEFLGSHAADVRGRVLEVGYDYYTRRFGGGRVTRSDVFDVSEGPKTTIIGDIGDAPQIASDTFDCIILTQTLQYLYDQRAAVRTLYRILKPGGVLLATFPGITSNADHQYCGAWYWNLTPISARRVFSEAFPGSAVEVRGFGNVLIATASLYGFALEELSREELDFHDRGYEVLIGVRARKPRPALVPSRTGSGQGLILMYHGITDVETDPFSLRVSPDHFARQLESLSRDATMLTLAEMVDCAKQGRFPDRAIAITFDDGYANNLHQAKPLLKKHGMPATVFVATGALNSDREFWWDELERILLTPGTLPETLELTIQGATHRWELGEAAQFAQEQSRSVRLWRVDQKAPGPRHSVYLAVWRLLKFLPETDRVAALDSLSEWSGSNESRDAYRPMRADEVTTLAQDGLIDIGAHSVTHPALGELAGTVQSFEIKASKDRLEGILGRPVTSFAYPYGSFSAETMELTQATGFHRACSTIPHTVDAGANCFLLPRIRVGDWNEFEFSGRMAGWFGHETQLVKG